MYDHCCIDGDHVMGLALPEGALARVGGSGEAPEARVGASWGARARVGGSGGAPEVRAWRFGEREHRLAAPGDARSADWRFGERESNACSPPVTYRTQVQLLLKK